MSHRQTSWWLQRNTPKFGQLMISLNAAATWVLNSQKVTNALNEKKWSGFRNQANVRRVAPGELYAFIKAAYVSQEKTVIYFVLNLQTMQICVDRQDFWERHFESIDS